MKGIILTNANYDTPSTRYQASRLLHEFEKLGVEVTVLKNDGSLCTLFERVDFDFCVFLDKDLYTAEYLNRSGVKVFNSPKSIRICDDKMLTYLALLDTDIAIPKTVAGVYNYQKRDVSLEKVAYLEKKLKYPMVVKLNSSSLGAGVFLARNKDELQKLLNEVSDKPHHVQEYVLESTGSDIRVIVVGGKVIASMLRRSESDFRSNVELGGKAKQIKLNTEYVELAEKVSRELGLDYCGVDILKGKSGPILCEVNSNAFFGGIEKVTGINVAKAYAEHVINVVKG